MSDTTETETETNTDTTDEPSKAELHDRVKQLESTVEKLMPSRRDALKLGAAGIAGAAGLSATTQPADAATGSAGQIGDSSNRPDVFADTVDANNLTGVSTGSIGDAYTFAGTVSGADADARLQTALSNATNGDVIFLEKATYQQNLTTNTQLTLVGTGYGSSASNIDANWTLSAARTTIRDFHLSGSLTLSGFQKRVHNFQQGTIDVAGSDCIITNGGFTDVTFQSGTSSGIVDSCVNTTVTDNGSNTVGDIG